MQKEFLKRMVITILMLLSVTTFASMGEIQTNASTTLPTDGWYKDGHDWYYLERNTKMNGWLKENGKWYYFYSDGKLAKQWINSNGRFYHTDLTGAIVKGWINDSDNWYYFGDDYSMQTGWNKIEGHWYYFYNNGIMAVNRIIDGYYVDEIGKSSTTPTDKDNKMTYDDAIAKAINYAFGNYNYITPVKFETGPIIDHGEYKFTGLIAEEDTNHVSNEIMFSSKPVTQENATDFDLISRDKWIVASATLSNDGSYHVTGQFYSVRTGMGKSKITDDPDTTCEVDKDSYIIVYTDGEVSVKGILVKNE